jgi:hypothetical protein
MKTAIGANRLTSRAIGSMFFAGFGALWFVLAFYVREMLNARTVTGVLLITSGLVVAALQLAGRAKRFPRLPDDPARSRSFFRVNAIQWIAIFVVVSILTRLHLDAWSAPAIAGIVGLHLFPLARLFGNPLHYVTGSLLVAWAAGTSILVPAEHVQGIAALGAGTILWLSAGVTLAMALRTAQQASPAQTAQGIEPEAA